MEPTYPNNLLTLPSKKPFKKIAIGDLTKILNEIDRMYTIVCENRKSEYNFPYELVDKIKM